ncbi:MAG: glycosyltransferase family 4 protein, partial [bacterium]|nr:glycosyltransferase family 4 protein [bacterium]
MPAKILYVVTQSEMGGAQRYVRDLATALGRYDFTVGVAAGEGGPLLTQLAAANIATFPLKHLRRQIAPFNDLTAVRELADLIKHWQPDLVHLNSSKAGVIGVLATRRSGTRCRVVYTAHGFVFNEPLPGWQRALYRTAERRSAPGKDVIICVSEADRQSAIAARIAPPGKLATIHPGISAEPASLPPQEARDRLRERGVPPHGLLVGTIAHLYPTKGLLDLISAAAQTVRQTPATFLIIGEGTQRALLTEKIRAAGLERSVLLLGEIPDAARLLPAIDVYASSSVKEGFPYALLEAMLAARAIVATAVGGVPEMISDNQHGLLVPAGDPAALAAAVARLLRSPEERERLSQAALN